MGSMKGTSPRTVKGVRREGVGRVEERTVVGREPRPVDIES